MEDGRREGEEEPSPWSNLKNKGFSFAVSLREGWEFMKASITGQVKKATARSEQEASEADLQMAKGQVEAIDEAENRKKHKLET